MTITNFNLKLYKKPGFLLYEVNISIIIIFILSSILASSYISLISNNKRQVIRLTALQYGVSVCEYLKYYKSVPKDYSFLGMAENDYKIEILTKSEFRQIDFKEMLVNVYYKDNKLPIINLRVGI